MVRSVVVPLLLLVASLPSGWAIAIPGGSIVVSQSGDGSSAPSQQGADATLVVLETSGKNPRPIEIPDDRLQLEGTAGGRLALSADGSEIGLAGYLPPFSGTGALSTRSDSDAPRGFVTVNALNGSVSEASRVKNLSADAADSVVTNGSRAWMSGRDNLVAWDGSTDVVFNGAGFFVNLVLPKGVRIFGDRLYLVATRPGQAGMIADFDGYPHGDSDKPRVLFDVPNPEDIAMSPDRATAYVARTEGVIQVFRKSGSSWTSRRVFSGNGAALRGVAVDFSGDKPVIYAISTGTLFRAVDNGKNAALQPIASSAGGRVFMGIVVTPGGGDPKVRVTSSTRFRTDKASVTIRGTAIDADGIRSVKVQRAGTSDSDAANGTTKWTAKVKLRAGRNVFLVRSEDKAGNLSNPVRVVITRD